MKLTKLQKLLLSVLKQLKKERLILLLSIIAILLTAQYIYFLLLPLKIVSTTPSSNEFFPNLTSNVLNFSLNKKVNKDDLKITFKPEVVHDIYYLSGNSYAVILPKGASLDSGTVYNIEIYFKNTLISEFSASTQNYNNLDSNTQFELFELGQKSLGEEETRILKEKPWSASLPIIEKDYIASWSESTNEIIVMLKLKTGDFSNKEEKILLIKKEINSRLERVGADPNIINIRYIESNI